MEGKHAPGLSEFRLRTHGRAGGVLLPHRRQGNPPARADPRARRADRARPDAVQGRRRFPGPEADGYLLVNSNQSFERTASRQDRRAIAGGPCPDRSGLRNRAQTYRPPAAQCGAARRLCRATGIVHLKSVAAAIREAFPEKIARRQYRRRHRGIRCRRRRAGRPPEGSSPCSNKSKAHAPWPRRSGSAGPRSSAPIRSRRRPTSSKASARWCAPARSRIANSSTSNSNSPRCRSPSAPRRPARAPIPRPRARACLFMAEAVYNASGLGLPIVMTLGNRAIGAPINIWNDHSDAMSMCDCRLDAAVRRDQPGSRRPAHPGLPLGRGTVDAGDGLRRRLYPHACGRAGRHSDAGRGRRLPAAL